MGSKKHKKHHKSDKKDVSFEERQEKPLKLVLKVGGSVQSPAPQQPPPPPPPPPTSAPSQTPSMPVSQPPRVTQESKPSFEEPKAVEKTSHSHEKHKKSKKKKKKKSTDKDKERHDRKRKHHHHHHHHREHSHERKEKRKKEQEASRATTESHESQDSLPVRNTIESHPTPIEKPQRDQRTCTLKRKALKSPLQILLYYLLKKLQQKDPQEFFAWPVTDVIAPGYSSIITNPTDFSTINKKIDDREYKSVAEYKADIKLMCDNAMTYNRADTVYYKSAKRMWHVAQKLMNRDQLMSLKRSFPYMMELSIEELGFDINSESEESLPRTEIAVEPGVPSQPEAKKSKVAPCWNSVEPDEDFSDEPSPEEILQQAQNAARAAADLLTLKRPNSKFGFLRQHENGSTTLAIIHPQTGEKEIKVNLEMLTGKLTQGTGTIAGFKEDSKNMVKLTHYSNYGSYSSYAPQYDSMFSNLSKEESDLVLSAYGDETGVQYAESLNNFARDSDYVMSMVDNLLDTLTGGEHSKTVKILEERRLIKEEEQAKKVIKTSSEHVNGNASPLTPYVSSSMSDIESLQTLEDIDLEISRLERAEGEGKKLENGEKSHHDLLARKHELLSQKRDIQQKLNNTTQLLQDLRKVQNERLSADPPPHLALVRQPSNLERELADKVTKQLIDVTSQLPPEAVVNVESLRKAMGISFRPTVTNSPEAKKARKPDSSRVDDPEKSTNDPSTPTLHDETILDHSSPPEVSADERRHHPDLDHELREFLETGPVLRVCDSPTGSESR